MTPACLGHPEPYDALMDYISGPEHRKALDAARAMCGACSLSATCLRDNAAEPWALAVLGRRLPATERPTCGTPAGYSSHIRHREETCERCREANRGKRPRRPRREAKCGTESGYKRHRRNGEPTCAACREAQGVANARRRERVAA